MHSASDTYHNSHQHKHLQSNPRGRQRRRTHHHTARSPAQSNTVAVRVRDRGRRLVDRPELRRVRGVAVRDVERLVRSAGYDAVRGDAKVPVRDLRGHAGALHGEERGDVRGGAVARKGGDEVRAGRGELGGEDEGGVCGVVGSR